MNYARLMSRILNQPLMLTPDNLSIFLSALTDRVGIDALTLGDGTELSREDMRAVAGSSLGREQKSYAVVDGVAVLPVSGSLVNKSGNVQPRSGMTGYDSIETRMWEALEDTEVHKILLDIDSGGGESAGAFDLADFIHEANAIKPVWAYAGEMAASAAFLVAAAADKLYLPRTGNVGSVGVVVAHQSMEGKLDKEGIKVTLIHSGDKKVDGNPFENLSDKVKADVQTRIDKLRDMFAERVAFYRGMDVADVLSTEAGMFTGSEAVSMGFADGVHTFNEVLSMAKKKEQSGPVVAAVQMETVQGTDDAQASVITETLTLGDRSITTTKLVNEVVAPAALDAQTVIELAKDAGFPQLALGIIESGYDNEQMEAAFAAATEIRDLCVAAGVEDSSILANMSKPVELVRAVLLQRSEAEIDTTHMSAELGEQKSGISTSEIWQKRKEV